MGRELINLLFIYHNQCFLTINFLIYYNTSFDKLYENEVIEITITYLSHIIHVPNLIITAFSLLNQTGCTSDDLKGLDVAMVQQKLVRALCNYKFAKFCWKSLVQPQLQGKSGVAGVTSWIDSNTKSRNVGVIDKILETISSNTQESTPQKQGMDIFLDVSFVAKFNRVSLNFGSSHMFTQPLVDINLRSVESNATGLLSKYGRLVPISEESNECNKIVFHGMISAMHLNTRHDYMECLMEPFPCFAHATYKVFLTEDGTDHDNEPESKHWRHFFISAMFNMVLNRASFIFPQGHPSLCISIALAF